MSSIVKIIEFTALVYTTFHRSGLTKGTRVLFMYLFLFSQSSQQRGNVTSSFIE